METKRFSSKEIQLASKLLKQGELVGIPTETVYGLGANGLNPEAVAKIFQVKGRPQDNPLILHVGSPEWIPRFCENIPDDAWKLAEAFWPGPLTMVLQAKSTVPAVVRGGLSTVGLRCPRHPVALALIQEADVPIAAPSGNLSGKPSPTTAVAMLEDMDGKISAVLDGGSCEIGVESTIISVGHSVQLLRAGGTSVEEIEGVLGREITQIHLKEEEAPLAPGMKYRHYAPKAPLTVVLGENSGTWLSNHVQKGEGVICFEEYATLFPNNVVEIIGKENDFTRQAQQVFSALRAFDHKGVTQIWAQCPAEKGLGLAVANRLQKAAGFHIINLERE